MIEEETAVRAEGLVKRYGDVVAVDGVDVAAHRGTCLGILGPNGAGKTTTIEMLEGIRAPDAGRVEILGTGWRDSPREIRERIGVQLQETDLERNLTVGETLRMFSSFYRETRQLEEVLRIVGLGDKRGSRVEHLSGGQKQRLSLGCALVNRPEILFLDEPTTGLDPQARRRVWEVVEAFKSEGGTVLLTTHYMEEAERLADELAIFDRGRIIAEGTPSEIVARLHAESIVELRPRGGPTGGGLEDAELARLSGVLAVRRTGAEITLSVDDTQAAVGALLGHLEARGVVLEDLRTHRPTLEDVFVSLTGKHLRDG